MVGGATVAPRRGCAGETPTDRRNRVRAESLGVTDAFRVEDMWTPYVLDVEPRVSAVGTSIFAARVRGGGAERVPAHRQVRRQALAGVLPHAVLCARWSRKRGQAPRMRRAFSASSLCVCAEARVPQTINFHVDTRLMIRALKDGIKTSDGYTSRVFQVPLTPLTPSFHSLCARVRPER